jgi:hypothetical protein
VTAALDNEVAHTATDSAGNRKTMAATVRLR